MKLLLTSSGISNDGIHAALVDLLDKPIAESNALFIPTGIYPFPGGTRYGWQAICGNTKFPFIQLGWKSMGVLELTALPSIDQKTWLPSLEDADALLVWGGDVLYLSYWMRQSGLTDLLASLCKKLVYVGVSAGSMAVSATFAEACTNPPGGTHNSLMQEDVIWDTPQGPISRRVITGHGAGLVDFALIPHFDEADHPDASAANAIKWAAYLPNQVYAIDDQTAIKVVDHKIEVISEGHWKLFNANPPSSGQ
jgi:dipeptidase E